MGAEVQFDLTSDVTHLIIGDFNTPKYRYVAKERPDVKPMTIKWIEAVRDQWVKDEPIDLEALEKDHTLPTLSSLKLSMTGCDDRMLHVTCKVRRCANNLSSYRKTRNC